MPGGVAGPAHEAADPAVLQRLLPNDPLELVLAARPLALELALRERVPSGQRSRLRAAVCISLAVLHTEHKGKGHGNDATAFVSVQLWWGVGARHRGPVLI